MDMSIGDILFFPKSESPVSAKAAKTSVQSQLKTQLDGDYYEIWGITTPIDINNQLMSTAAEIALVKIRRYGRADQMPFLAAFGCHS